MTRALRAEWRRLVARRATRLMVLAMILVSLLVAVTLWFAYRPPSPAEQAQINAQYQAALADFNQHKQVYINQCLAAQAEQRKTDPKFDGNCTEAGLRPSKEEMGWNAPELQVVWDSILGGIGPTLAGALALILGATLIGAEYSSRNLSTWLVFEPRRTRVYLSKLVACAGGGLIVYLVGLVVMLAAAWLVVRVNQGTFDLSANYWTALFAPKAAWGAGVVAAAGLLAGAITFVSRRTIITLAVVVGYFGLIEAALAHFVTLVRPYTLGNNVLALIRGTRAVQTSSCSGWFTSQFGCQAVTATIQRSWAGVGLAGLLLVIGLIGWLFFRRRDIAN